MKRNIKQTSVFFFLCRPKIFLFNSVTKLLFIKIFKIIKIIIKIIIDLAFTLRKLHRLEPLCMFYKN